MTSCSKILWVERVTLVSLVPLCPISGQLIGDLGVNPGFVLLRPECISLGDGGPRGMSDTSGVLCSHVVLLIHYYSFIL